MGKWEFFTDEESVGMTDEVCEKRDLLRKILGFPVIQTCGIRSEEQAIKDGCPHSAHVTGQAFDMVASNDPFIREKIAHAAGLAGLMRGESCPKHFHFDVDRSKPHPDYFQGPDK